MTNDGTERNEGVSNRGCYCDLVPLLQPLSGLKLKGMKDVFMCNEREGDMYEYYYLDKTR